MKMFSRDSAALAEPKPCKMMQGSAREECSSVLKVNPKLDEGHCYVQAFFHVFVL